MFRILCDFSVILFLSFICGVQFQEVLEAKFNKKIQLTLFCLLSILPAVLFHSFSPLHLVYLAAVNSLYVFTCFRNDWQKKLQTLTVNFFSIFFSITSSAALYIYVMNAENFRLLGSSINEHLSMWFVCLMIFSVLSILVSMIMRKVKKFEFIYTGIVLLSIALCFFSCLAAFFTPSHSDDIKAKVWLLFAMGACVVINTELTVIPSILWQKIEHKTNIDYGNDLSNMEFNYYKMSLENDRKLKALRHDIANHIQTVYFLLENGENRRGLEMLNKLKEEYSLVNQMVYCENPVVNIILSNKKREAEEKGIDIHIRIKDSFSNIPVTDFDLSTIISNLVDNAIRGCIVSEQSKPRLVVEMLQKNNYFVIRILNSCKIGMSIDNTDRIDTTKTDGSIHGIGMPMVSRIVKKYKGDFVVAAQNGIFTATVVMSMK